MADTFSPNTVAPPPGISSPLTAQVLQHTLHALHTLLAEPPHSRAGSWCQQRQRALLWRNRQRLQLLAGFRADGSADLLHGAMGLTQP
ncbi:hypothetical protein [Giesbergeria anulus]|uniref:Uncharacterized protein n=1 Tax=Giesbergeria anulus TaxID=180197 RepID=A0A1H9QE95_9BURK|nr:hypothetical protein [Giesbergeria anulus]MBX9936627.1 hypothetical protein [Burkholderiaceae bacterium]SER58856.1 hypothetical protein SAMN02982919_02642 [Giesbergeria anulus]